MKKSFASWIGVLAVSLILGLAFGANASDSKPSLDEMVASAKSNADHMAIATAYEEQATDLDRRATMHERLGKQYKAGAGNPKAAGDMARHCERIAGDLKETAKLHRELANHHRAMASGKH